MSVTEQLVKLLARPILQKDRERAAMLLLDWTGCAVAGQKEPAGQKLVRAFPQEVGPCRRIGTSTASVLMAALHNGCLGNVLEMDDVDKRAVLHAAPTVIPAALAMAEYVSATTEEVLNAIVIGYEATIRIGRAVGPGHYAFWHNTATCGTFGAAAAACHLLTGSDMVSAMGLAGTQAAGLWQTRHEPDSMAKQLHAGHAAHAGVLAAILSAQGFQGPRMILDGEQGFFAAMCPGADPENVLTDEGAGWHIHETSLKPYPACRHTHAAIDAALMARTSHASIDGIIEVETYADALKFCNRPNPHTTIEAKFSLQHSVAVTLIKGTASLADFDINNTSTRITELRDRIAVKATKAFTNAYPAHYGAAIMVAGHRYVAKDALGDPERPLSQAAVRNKALMLMSHAGLTPEKSEAIAEAALGSDFNAYLDLLP